MTYSQSMLELGRHSLEELLNIYNQSSCQCDETGMYDQFLVVERAEGLNVWFKEQSEPYLDLVMGFSTANFGHQHPGIRKAFEEAARTIDHVHSFNSESKLLLGQALAEKAPGASPKKVYFPIGGAMSVDVAIKLARAYTGKTKLACFSGAFHGYSYGAMSVTDDAIIDKALYAPFPMEAVRLPYADCYRCPDRLDCHHQCLQVAEERLSQDGDIAAMIIETIQGHAGYVIPPAEFISGLKKLCQERGILFIDDEIQVGMGRTGKLFAIEHFEVEPDIILLSKALAGGYYPLSAVIARADIWNSVPAAGAAIGSTYVNSPLATRVALEALRILEEDGLIENAASTGAYFTEKLKGLERFENIDNVTGLGLTQSFAVVKSKETREPAPEITRRLQSEALRQHVIISRHGINNDRIKFILPLLITREEIDMIVARFDGIVATVLARG